MLLVITFSLLLPMHSQSHDHKEMDHHQHDHHEHHSDRKFEIENAYIKLTPPGINNTAAYFTLTNNSQASVSIVKASAKNLAERIELHEHVKIDGLMKMQEVKAVEVNTGESIDFEPGGYHIMMINLARKLTEGEKVNLTITLDSGKTIHFKATVRDSHQKHSGHEHHEHHHH